MPRSTAAAASTTSVASTRELNCLDLLFLPFSWTSSDSGSASTSEIIPPVSPPPVSGSASLASPPSARSAPTRWRSCAPSPVDPAARCLPPSWRRPRGPPPSSPPSPACPSPSPCAARSRTACVRRESPSRRPASSRGSLLPSPRTLTVRSTRLRAARLSPLKRPCAECRCVSLVRCVYGSSPLSLATLRFGLPVWQSRATVPSGTGPQWHRHLRRCFWAQYV